MIPDYKIKINDRKISHSKVFLLINKKKRFGNKILQFKAFK